MCGEISRKNWEKIAQRGLSIQRNQIHGKNLPKWANAQRIAQLDFKGGAVVLQRETFHENCPKGPVIQRDRFQRISKEVSFVISRKKCQDQSIYGSQMNCRKRIWFDWIWHRTSFYFCFDLKYWTLWIKPQISTYRKLRKVNKRPQNIIFAIVYPFASKNTPVKALHQSTDCNKVLDF